MVVLDTETPGTSREFTVRMLKVRLELAIPELQTQCPSHSSLQLKSYCWEGVEFIQLVYCIIIYLSFLNCDWLLIWEVEWFYWTQKLLVPVEKLQWGYRRWDSNSQSLDYKPSAQLAIDLYSSKAIAGKELSLSSCVLHHYIFIISQLWLTSYPRSRVVVLDTETPGTSREFTVRMLKVRLELAIPELQTQCPSHSSLQLKSYCWEGVEFIQLVYCIIIYLSFLNCDWLLIWEVEWFYWTQKLLVPVEKLQWGYRRWDSNSQSLDYKPSAQLAIDLYSSKAIAGKELSLSSCVLHHYIFIISQLWLTSYPRSRVVVLDTETPGTSREFTVRMLKVRLELAIPELQTQCPSHSSLQLKSYCWEGVEFIQLVYCIIIYLSFLNYDWLLIWEVQWFYWTQELLVPGGKFTMRMSMVRLELRWEVNHSWQMINI